MRGASAASVAMHFHRVSFKLAGKCLSSTYVRVDAHATQPRSLHFITRRCLHYDSVAYDRSSAPKDCQVSGWFHGQDDDPSMQSAKMFKLVEFTYDLERSNAQTFNIEATDGIGTINMVRLDFTSNHGSPHTCIYRLRVHGYEPGSVPSLALQP